MFTCLATIVFHIYIFIYTFHNMFRPIWAIIRRVLRLQVSVSQVSVARQVINIYCLNHFTIARNRMHPIGIKHTNKVSKNNFVFYLYIGWVHPVTCYEQRIVVLIQSFCCQLCYCNKSCYKFNNRSYPYDKIGTLRKRKICIEAWGPQIWLLFPNNFRNILFLKSLLYPSQVSCKFRIHYSNVLYIIKRVLK
jgi:hypothetical protein